MARLRIEPGGTVGGPSRVPGDKSIAHRWLMLAATAHGVSRVLEVPASLDVRSTAACVERIAPRARPGLELWSRNAAAAVEGGGSTWNVGSSHGPSSSPLPALQVEGDGRNALVENPSPLDCGNSGTSMRLLAGLLAAAPFRSVLVGDASLSRRPMERVAEPLRSMGATVQTRDGHAPITIHGGGLRGIRVELPVASAQVKSAVLLAALAADGPTTVVERAPTRDHTERALAALGVPIAVDGTSVTVEPSTYGGFEATVPGDPSSAAYLLAAAALTGAELTILDVGVNPSRTRYVDVMRRMRIAIGTSTDRHELGEPVGRITVRSSGPPEAVRIERDELPLVIDEVPVLAALAAHAEGRSTFAGAGELRLKESDRLTGLASGLERLGGHAAIEGDDLVVAGGGLRGGHVVSDGDHRMAMAFAVAGLAADAPIEIDGIEAEAVSFPGFSSTLRALGARAEVMT